MANFVKYLKNKSKQNMIISYFGSFIVDKLEAQEAQKIWCAFSPQRLLNKIETI